MTEAAEKKSHAPPAYDARIQSSPDNWETVGAAWNTARKNVLSVTLTKPVDSFILVPRKPKPVAAKVAEQQPAA